MPTRRTPTLIIGAGVAGLACARRLAEYGASFLLVSEDVGGRVCTSSDGLNLGAYFVMEHYARLGRFVDRTRRIRLRDMRLHSEDSDAYTILSPRVLRLLPEMLRFTSELRRFLRHYLAFQTACESTAQIDALDSDPYLRRLYDLPATVLVRELRMERFAAEYVSYAMRSITFTEWRNLNALTLLSLSLPLIEPIYEFRLRIGELTRPFIDRMVVDTITTLHAAGGGWRATGERGVYVADRVVLATSPDRARALVVLPAMKRGIDAHVFRVRGQCKRMLMGPCHLFGGRFPVVVIAEQRDGSHICVATVANPDLRTYFETVEVIDAHAWRPAFNLIGTQGFSSQIRPCLFLAGDYNVCSLEDAYITGIYTANAIAGRTRS